MGKDEHKLHKSNTNLHGLHLSLNLWLKLTKEISVMVEEIMNKAT
jgi:hypothetical protein